MGLTNKKGICQVVNQYHEHGGHPVSYTHLDVYKRQLSQSIGYVKDCYRQWAAPAVRPGGKKTVGIIYCSAYGCTRALADAAAKALTADGMQVTTLDVVFAAPETVSALVNACDVVLFGTPTINRNAPEAIWNAVHGVDAINTRGRAAGAFGSFGWTGEAAGMVQEQLLSLIHI